jgi:hypothetical protein
VSDDDIRAAWASGGYSSRRKLEEHLFGFSGGKAHIRVMAVLGPVVGGNGSEVNDDG